MTPRDSELSVLLLGPLGPPHIQDQALAMKQRGLDVRVGGNGLGGATDPVLEQAGIPLSQAPETSRARPGGMLAGVRWARGLVAGTNPDVVHAHWLPGFGFVAAAIGASPLALTVWGSDVYRATALQRLANRYALRRADLLMADSRDLLEACGADGSRPRSEVVQWGVDLKKFRPPSGDERTALKRELGLGPGPVILSPRSFMPVYNIPTVIEAFRRVGDALPDAQLVLKHMGPITIELPPFPHAERVTVIGNVPYARMADYYRAADVCVSLTSSDSSPRSVWEAMASGCPCVLSDLPWVAELIEPGVDALTVPLEAGAGAEAVLRVLREQELRERLSQRGRDLVERHLDREREMDRLAALYAELAL
jgi:L-malate glycosyltransferase